MEIIIKISEEDYKQMQHILYTTKDPKDSIEGRAYLSIVNGAILPKEHGKIVDMDEISLWAPIFIGANTPTDRVVRYTSQMTEEDKEQYKAEGRKDAWEVAKKLIWTENDVGYPYDELKMIFGTTSKYDIFKMSNEEVAEKINAYEENKAKFNVGDEVIYKDCRYVVTKWPYYVADVKNKQAIKLWSGQNMVIADVCKVKKTGKQFPQIKEIIERLYNGNINK